MYALKKKEEEIMLNNRAIQLEDTCVTNWQIEDTKQQWCHSLTYTSFIFIRQQLWLYISCKKNNKNKTFTYSYNNITKNKDIGFSRVLAVETDELIIYKEYVRFYLEMSWNILKSYGFSHVVKSWKILIHTYVLNPNINSTTI